MNKMFRFPLWSYLNQPLFSSSYKAVLNPRRFWYIYQIYWLERCWTMDGKPEEHPRS
ncbi:hypothetical protein H6G20_04605 [Desertifilum sp. FACHB-1129]|uniref:Uncharacterized protein n=2 Tax=Cyanophyceae TaxID=3028117 RepID=A0ACD5GQQ1_9CYAN|nr:MULTISPECIES: hypothetical protein [Cyanophyceae]MCD8487410.1 hypothetical protein [Desertifilum sp.]MDA0208763.1 hypothetical protein [Cyanobacteria bacterium FC1]MDI9640306.1 hypothetical protein [Geitlerinema splendidum]MDK3159171.1 hypothetical protein [Kamptonema cortianum]MBD2310965.1 hypothetical protein [Desertifilum sp. FACHB-1129]